MSDTEDDLFRPRDDIDTQLTRLWHSALSAIKMAQDIVDAGGRLHVSSGILEYLPDAAIVNTHRDAVLGMAQKIIATAVVDREGVANAAE